MRSLKLLSPLAALSGAFLAMIGRPSIASAVTTTVVAQHSAKCLDVRGGPQATNDGALIEQWTCTGASNQAWTLNDTGAGLYELVASNSGKCAEAAGGGTANGTAIHQATCSRQPQQLWRLRSRGSTVFEIVHVASNRCLDVTGGPQAVADGALTELWTCTGSPNQAWSLTPPPVAPAAIVAKHSGKCLDVRGGPQATSSGAPLEQWTCTGAANQSWTIVDVNGGVQLKASHSGKCIEAVGGTANGTPIQQQDCSTRTAQLWTMQMAGSPGEYNFVHPASGRCLDKGSGVLARLSFRRRSWLNRARLGATGVRGAKRASGLLEADQSAADVRVQPHERFAGADMSIQGPRFSAASLGVYCRITRLGCAERPANGRMSHSSDDFVRSRESYLETHDRSAFLPATPPP